MNARALALVCHAGLFGCGGLAFFWRFLEALAHSQLARSVGSSRQAPSPFITSASNMRRLPYVAIGCVSAAGAAYLTPDGRDKLPSEYLAMNPDDWRYTFDAKSMAACKTATCTPLALDSASRSCAAATDLSMLHFIKAAVLSLKYEHYEVSGLLEAPATHLLSTEQWREVLSKPSGSNGRALDVGAGCGFVTATLAPLFECTYATEVYDILQPPLKSRGFAAAITRDPSDAEALRRAGLPTSGYDCVFALNVLDRVPRADAFLQSLISLLAPGGKLVLSIPLPHKHINTEYAEEQTKGDALPLRGATWEDAADDVCRHLERSGLRVQRLARTPYLSQGLSALGGAGPGRPFALDAAIFVCTRSTTVDLRQAKRPER